LDQAGRQAEHDRDAGGSSAGPLSRICGSFRRTGRQLT
jgi:hypothetical protein